MNEQEVRTNKRLSRAFWLLAREPTWSQLKRGEFWESILGPQVGNMQKSPRSSSRSARSKKAGKVI